MTSNDVRDILSLPGRRAPEQEAGPSRPRAPPPLPGDARPRTRPEGITRELYALLGPNAPSLVMGGGGDAADAASQRAFQPKFQRKAGARARRWVWTPFRNQARSDTATGEEGAAAPRGLVLHHWQPQPEGALDAKEEADAEDAEAEAQLDATWAPFNTSSQVFHYSTEEYNQHLRDDDWTKDETDYLIDMCEEYDLRFIVIADRYEWPGKTRSIEDLKSRYYTICRRLIRSRISNEDLETRQSQLQAFTFDRQQEVERKRAVQQLLARTPEQLAEEEALYVEARRLEQNEAKFAREREELMRLLGGWESLPNSTPSSVAAVGAGIVWPAETEGQAADAEAKRAKKRKTDLDPATAAALLPPGALKGVDQKQLLFDAQHCITRFQTDAHGALRLPYPHLVGTPSVQSLSVAPGGSSGTKAEQTAHHGVFLRSTRMLGFRPNQFLRATQALAELHPPIGPRLVFPTATNIEKWETLIGAVASSLEMKKQVDRVDAEYRIAQARLASLESSGSAGDASATVPKEEPGTPGAEPGAAS